MLFTRWRGENTNRAALTRCQLVISKRWRAKHIALQCHTDGKDQYSWQMRSFHLWFPVNLTTPIWSNLFYRFYAAYCLPNETGTYSIGHCSVSRLVIMSSYCPSVIFSSFDEKWFDHSPWRLRRLSAKTYLRLIATYFLFRAKLILYILLLLFLVLWWSFSLLDSIQAPGSSLGNWIYATLWLFHFHTRRKGHRQHSAHFSDLFDIADYHTSRRRAQCDMWQLP